MLSWQQGIQSATSYDDDGLSKQIYSTSELKITEERSNISVSIQDNQIEETSEKQPEPKPTKGVAFYSDTATPTKTGKVPYPRNYKFRPLKINKKPVILTEDKQDEIRKAMKQRSMQDIPKLQFQQVQQQTGFSPDKQVKIKFMPNINVNIGGKGLNQVKPSTLKIPPKINLSKKIQSNPESDTVTNDLMLDLVMSTFVPSKEAGSQTSNRKTEVAKTLAQSNKQKLVSLPFKKGQSQDLTALSMRAKSITMAQSVRDAHAHVKTGLMEQIDSLKQQLQDHDRSLWLSVTKNVLDIGFLFASPLVFKDVKGWKTFPQLDFVNESKNIKSAILKSNKAIKFKGKVATCENFSEMLQENPRILHISCHGIQLGYSNESCLLLEKQQDPGEGVLVKSKQIQNLLESENSSNLELVFLAACHSELIGNVFVNSGVKHVICIKKDKKVLDQAALTFTKCFYKELMDQKSVCDAFSKAKGHVEFKFKSGEASLFTLLPKENTHDCTSISKNNEGSLECASDHVQIKSVLNMAKHLNYRDGKMQKLLFREKKLQELVKALVNENLVLLRGPTGIGKTTILRNAFQYILERKYFTGGVILIDLKNSSVLHELIRQLKRMLIKTLFLQQGSELKALQSADYEQFMETLINFFEQEGSSAFALRNQRFKGKRNEYPAKRKFNFLLGLDNAEALLKGDERQEFKDFITQLRISCSSLNIIVSSSQGRLPDSDEFIPTNIYLNPLLPNQAAELFLLMMQNNAKLDDDDNQAEINHSQKLVSDVCNLILEDQSFSIKELGIPGLDKIEQVPTEGEKNKLMKWLGMDTRCILKALQLHSIFRKKIIPGNPCLIIRYSQLYSNPHSKVNSLLDVFEKAKQQKIPNEAGDDSKSCFLKYRNSQNYLSLWNCTEESVLLLKEHHPESHALLLLLGCLPVGLQKEQICHLMAKEEEIIETYCNVLHSFNFLEPNNNIVQASSYLIDYVRSETDEELLHSQMINICRFYKDFLQIYYEINSIIDENNPKVQDHADEDQASCKLTFLELIRLSPKERRITNTHSQSLMDNIDSSMANIERCLNYFTSFAEDENEVLEQEQIKDQSIEQSIQKPKKQNSDRKLCQYMKSDTQERFNDKAPIKFLTERKVSKSRSIQEEQYHKEESHASTEKDDQASSKVPSQFAEDESILSNQELLETKSKQNPEDEMIGGILWSELRHQLDSSHDELDLPVFLQRLSDSEFESMKQLLRSDHELSEYNLADLTDQNSANQLRLLTSLDFMRNISQDSPDQITNLGSLVAEDDTDYQEEQSDSDSSNSQDEYSDTFSKLNKRVSVKTMKPTDASPDQLSEISYFILLSAANYYLSHDVEHCMRICQITCQHMNDDSLFKGNILRFMALAQEQTYLQLVDKSEINDGSRGLYDKQQSIITSSDKTTCLHEAVQSVEASIEVFKSGSANFYGIALASFQLGYLLEVYAEALAKEDASVSQEEYYRQAQKHFEVSLSSFTNLNHLAGMYLSKKHIRRVLINLSNGKNDKDLISLQAEVENMHKTYNEYVWTVGLAQSCSITRKQGEEVSLMTEIVISNRNNDLYLRPKDKHFDGETKAESDQALS